MNPNALDNKHLSIDQIQELQERLKKAEEEAAYYKYVLDAVMQFIPEGITIADAPNVNIRYISQHGIQTTGRPESDLAKIPAELHPEQWQIYHQDRVTMAHPDELPLTRATTLGEVILNEEWILKKSDGTFANLLCNAGPIRNDLGEITGGIIAWRDITEWQQTKVELSQTNTRSKFLSDTISQLLMAEDPQSAVEDLCQKVMSHLDCHVFFNFLATDEPNQLKLNAYSGIPDEDAADLQYLEYGTAICGCVAQRKKRIVAEYIQDSDDERANLVRSYGVRAYACHPWLAKDGQTLGTVSFGTRSRDRFTEEELSLLKSVCEHIAVALDRKRTQQQLQELNENLENRVRERTHALTQSQMQLRQLVSELILTEQREKKRLAGELHDFLAQMLVLCSMKLQKVNLAKRPENTTAVIKEVLDILDRSLQYTRNLIAELNPPVLEESGLVEATKWLSKQMEKHELKVHVRIIGELEIPQGERAILLYQTLRELLMNIIKHAQVQEAQIIFKQQNQNECVISVQDEGKGFQPKEIDNYASRNHFGLLNIQERIRSLGGHFEIQSSPNCGTKVTLTVPLSNSSDIG